MAPTHYGAVAKFLHWTIGLGILGMIALGWYMNDLPLTDPLKFTLFQLHKSVGVTILLLGLFRLGWRLTHPVPLLPANMAAWEAHAAKIVVKAFYVLMIVIPLLGWAVVSASPRNIPTFLYGLVPWPHLPLLPDMELDVKKRVAEKLGDVHAVLAYSVLAFLALHVGGALKHHFIKRDDVLIGMAPNFLVGLLNWLRGKKNA